MIFIKRSQCPAVLNLEDPNSGAAKEYQRALAAVLAGASKPPSSTFKIYAHPTVKEALRTLFENKCAYCESLVAGSQDTDVEHFRPKAEITEAKAAHIDHPGYWWLAMDWTNLTLSCSHCNQGRRQVVIGPNMTVEEVREMIERDETVHAGKANAFPTQDSVWVTNYLGDLGTEKPLLIDPTKCDPEDHLEWVLDGSLSTVVPKNNSKVGEVSIRIFGLNRRLLTEDRKVFLSELILIGNKVISSLNLAKVASLAEVAEAHRQAALSHLDVLEAKSTNERPYAALSRAYRKNLEKQIESMI